MAAYSQALAGLDARINYERNRARYEAGPGGYGTLRMARLLARLGNPHRAAPAIHVAGTKGKGSVTRLAARLLAARNLRVGEYMSPHVLTPRERIVVDGSIIGEGAFARQFGAADDAAHAEERATGDPATWFELFTAIAFLHFRESRVDAMAIETGLGGRLDATNLPDLPALAAGITPISLDHQDLLGDTLEAIAGEKAGILRPEAAAVFARQPPEAAKRLDAQAKRLSLAPAWVGTDYIARLESRPPPDCPESPQHIAVTTPAGKWPRPVRLAWPGSHQLGNAMLALGLVDAFWRRLGEPPVSPGEADAAWGEAPSLPGRLDVLGRQPWVIADGAHNPAAIMALVRTLEERFTAAGRMALVFASADDKDWRAMLRRLAPLAVRVIFTRIDSPRSWDPGEGAAWLSEEGLARERFPDIIPAAEEALAFARRATPPDGLMLATGSFVLAGAVRRMKPDFE